MTIHLNDDAFAAQVEQAIRSLPKGFRKRLTNVAVDIEPEPSAELRAKMADSIAMGAVILGLYNGVPITRKSVAAPWEFPIRIVIFQKNIERACDSNEEIIAQVRRTVLHEVGHHFGMSEADLQEFGY